MNKSENQDFLLSAKNLKTTNFISLTVGHLLFGALYPDYVLIAACGFALFSGLALVNYMSDPEINSNKKGSSQRNT